MSTRPLATEPALRLRRRPAWGPYATLAVLATASLLVSVRRPAEPGAVGRNELLVEGEYLVVEVIDATTLVCALDLGRGLGRPGAVPIRVRLFGVHLPAEEADEGLRAALDFVRQAEGVVQLQFERQRLDEDGTPLALVFSGSRLLNADLLAGGWGKVRDMRGAPSPWQRRLAKVAGQTLR